MGAALAAAGQAARVKTRLLAAASHDLRQPLQTNRVSIEVVREKVLDREVRGVLAKIQDTARGTEHLLDAVPDITRLEDAHGLLWVIMVTSAGNRGWPGDLPVNDLASAGLPVPSAIRTARIATIEAADVTRLGRPTPATLRQVTKRPAGHLGLGPGRV